ncbi:hypothetical protein O181_111477 [Austropuccinia psidii MF-1]|uniref:Reverse transcriptase Ty1/copia-type domain-containing protein n=1 Tax=Austropuccinia psidii MF-1 TaxID=1389203 RepID=A0A9Q3PTE8_9BASI|nr:hypothetical protein [Austropuccinia psidii MF-1]
MGPADLLSGVKIQKLKEGITLDQQHFIDSLLDLYGMKNCNSFATPLVPNEHIIAATVEEEEAFKRMINFRSPIGTISYLSQSFSCSEQSLSTLREAWNTDLKAFLHVLKYLCGIQEVGLFYSWQGMPGLIAFSNTDLGNCHVTWQSTSIFLAQLHGYLVFLKSREQPSVSISTAKAEYKSLCDLTSEILWLRQWCHEANILRFDNEITVWEDKQRCIKTANGNCNVSLRGIFIYPKDHKI